MRPTIRRSHAALSAAISAIVLLASCGGGGEDAAGKSPVVDAGEEAPQTITPAAASVSEDIERLRVLGFEVFETPDVAEVVNEESALALQLFPSEPEDATTETGLVRQTSSFSAGLERPAIVGGSLAQASQFPFVVFVSSPSGNCTGSLIGARWVKTAAHCLNANTPASSVTVFLGSVINGTGVEVKSADYFVRFSGDAALIRLSTPSSFQPVAYNGDADFDSTGPYTTLGFGRVSESGPVSNLKFVENTVSSESGGGMYLGTDNSFSTACYGDSGGPTIRYNPAGYPIDIAITSATVYPYCTGKSYHLLNAALAPQIQQVTGVAPGTVPTGDRPPQIAQIGTVVTPLGATSVQIVASDPEGNGVVFTATDLPPGLTINGSTGVISGTTVDYTYGGPYNVTVYATDSKTGAKTSTSFPWVVNTPGNADPAMQEVPTQVTRAGTAVSLPVVATDPNGDTLSFTATGLPPGLTCSPSGSITGAPTRGGSYQVNVRAVDGKGGFAIRSFIWAVQNQSPTIRLAESTTVPTFVIGTAVNVPFVKSDPDGDPVTVTALGLPKGVVVDQAMGTIRGISTVAGSYLVNLVASDPYGGNANLVFNLLISAANNHPPTMTQLSSRTDAAGSAVAIPIQSSDEDGHKTTIAFRNLPPGLTYDAVNKQLRGTPTKGGTYLVDYYIYDAFGARTTYPQITWVVLNNPPSLSAPENVTLTPGSVVQIPISSMDPDGHSYSITATGLPKGVVVNNITKILQGTVMQSGTFKVSLVATDKYQGKSAVQTFSITVPNEPPTISQTIGNMVMVAGTPVNLPLAISDPEGHRLTLSIGGLTVVTTPSSLPPGLALDAINKRIYGTPSRAGNFTVSIKVADMYGAASYMPPFVWSITNQKPVLASVASQTVVVGAAFELQLRATDGDTHVMTYSATGLPPGLKIRATDGLIYGTPTKGGAYSVRLTVSDKYGGVSSPQMVQFTATI